jgi:hypothetical protein
MRFGQPQSKCFAIRDKVNEWLLILLFNADTGVRQDTRNRK